MTSRDIEDDEELERLFESDDLRVDAGELEYYLDYLD